jgi:Antitoxin of toxin-antitoxin, RelE / RelB, TA system
MNFSEAKTALSAVMDDVVHEHRPQVVHRRRGGGSEQMLLVRPDDVRRLLEGFRFDLRVTLDEGEAAVVADPVGVVGVGDSLDGALEDLVQELDGYAERFFSKPGFYAQTDAVRHEPWLLRFALTPPDERRGLLEKDVAASAPEPNRVGAIASAV